MFCPPGFELLNEVTSYVHHLSRDISWAKHTKKLSENDSSLTLSQIGLGWAESNFQTCWMIANLCNNVDIYACSRDGTLLRITSDFIKHADFDPRDKHSFLSFEASNKFPPTATQSSPENSWTYFSNRFLFVHINTGMFKSDIQIDWHIDELEKDFGKTGLIFLEPDLRSLEKVAKGFSEWSICFRKDELDLKENQFLEALGLDNDTLKEINANAMREYRIGTIKDRKRKRDIIFDAYSLIYPDGHEAVGDSGKVAQNRVSDELGFRVDDSTFRRAIGKRI